MRPLRGRGGGGGDPPPEGGGSSGPSILDLAFSSNALSVPPLCSPSTRRVVLLLPPLPYILLVPLSKHSTPDRAYYPEVRSCGRKLREGVQRHLARFVCHRLAALFRVSSRSLRRFLASPSVADRHLRRCAHLFLCSSPSVPLQLCVRLPVAHCHPHPPPCLRQPCAVPRPLHVSVVFDLVHLVALPRPYPACVYCVLLLRVLWRPFLCGCPPYSPSPPFLGRHRSHLL